MHPGVREERDGEASCIILLFPLFVDGFLLPFGWQCTRRWDWGKVEDGGEGSIRGEGKRTEKDLEKRSFFSLSPGWQQQQRSWTFLYFPFSFISYRISSKVRKWGQKLMEQVSVRRVDFDPIESGHLRALRSGDELGYNFFYFGFR